MDFLPGASHVSTIIRGAFEQLGQVQAASLWASRGWNPSLLSFGFAAFRPGNPSFSFPPQQMELLWYWREVSVCSCYSVSFLHLPAPLPGAPTLKEKKCPGESKKGDGLPLAPCTSEKDGIVWGKCQGRSCKFINCFYRASSLALTRWTSSDIPAGFCTSPHFSLLQRGNKLLWNRVTFSIILSFIFHRVRGLWMKTKKS